MFSRLIDKKLGLSPDNKDYRKAYFILSVLGVLVAVLSFFIYFNIFVVPLYHIAILDAVSLLAAYFCWYALIKRKNIELASTVLVVIIFTLTLLFVIDQNHKDYAFGYAVILPIVSIYLNGIRGGLIYSLVYFSILLPVTYFGIDTWAPAEFTSVSFTNLTVVFFIVILLITYYEKSRAEAFKALEKLSITDKLTGLFNRHHIDKKVHELYSLSHRYQVPFTLILLDIDDFKKVNDTYGHIQGDKVLKTVSKLLRLNSRESDIVGRWGGEEFIIICPNTDIDSAVKVAEKMRKAIEMEIFDIDIPVTASFGISNYSNHKSYEDLIIKVDKALYQAKTSGKNTIVTVDA